MTLSKEDGIDNLKKFNMSSMQMTNKSMHGTLQNDPNKLNIVKIFKK